MRADAPSPEPVEEVVVPGSRLTPLLVLTLGPVTAALSCMALAIWWTSGVATSITMLLACAGGVVLGLGVTAWSVRELCLPLRLVLGRDALQVMRGRRVVVRVPFANMAGVAYQKRDAARSIRIDLVDPADPATFGPHLRASGHVVELPLTASNFPTYAGKPKAIFDAVELRLEEFRSRHPS
jgi:hypothetical protein